MAWRIIGQVNNMYKVNDKYLNKYEMVELVIEAKFGYPVSLIAGYITSNRFNHGDTKKACSELNMHNTGAKKNTYISEELFDDCVDLLLGLQFIE